MAFGSSAYGSSAYAGHIERPVAHVATIYNLPYVATVYDGPTTIGIVQDIPLTSGRVYDKPLTL